MKSIAKNFVFAAVIGCLAQAQDPGAIVGPDSREIPIPRIKTAVGILPGVRELPVRKQLPDVMTMNDVKKVDTRVQWQKRREERERILEYYAVGQMPPPGQNLLGA
jgi:hypothetical protein